MGDIKKHTQKKDPHIFYWKDPSWFSLRSGSSATNGRFHLLGGVNQSDESNLLLFSGSDLILLPMTQLKTEKRQKESQIGDKSEMDRTNELTCRFVLVNKSTQVDDFGHSIKNKTKKALWRVRMCLFCITSPQAKVCNKV